MEIRVSLEDQFALQQALATQHGMRQWWRYYAIVLLGKGQRPAGVAAALGCSEVSVCTWAAACELAGLAGLHVLPHAGGKQRHLNHRAEQALEALLADDPQKYGHQATGWTVLLL